MMLKTVGKILLVFLFLIIGVGVGLTVGVVQYPREVFHEKAKSSATKYGEEKWYHLRELVGAGFRDIVRPNQDTIYSSVFVNLSKGPRLLSVPPIDSYFSFAVYNDETDVIGYVASRTHGTGKARKILLVPPDYRGDTGGYEVIKSPSEMVWVLGRFLIREEEDYPKIHQIQDSLKLTNFTK